MITKKQTVFLALICFTLLTVILASCTSKSDRKMELQEQQKPVTAEPVIKPVEIPVAAIPKGIVTFTPEKMEVDPVLYNQNDLIGEGQTPGTSYKAGIYFTAGDKELKLVLYEYYYNSPKYYNDSGEINDESRERQSEEKAILQKAKDCYTAIKNSSFSDLIIEDQNGRVITVKKKISVTEKKDGNAIIRQDSVIQLYPY